MQSSKQCLENPPDPTWKRLLTQAQLAFPWFCSPGVMFLPVTVFVCHSFTVGLPVPLNAHQQAPSAGAQVGVSGVVLSHAPCYF